MRTTLDLHKEALALGKARARCEGKALGEGVSEAVFTAFRDRARIASPVPFDPLVPPGSAGARRGVAEELWKGCGSSSLAA